MENIVDSLQLLAIDIDSFHEDPKNAKKLPQMNLETLQESLKTYGQKKPIQVNSEAGIIEAENPI